MSETTEVADAPPTPLGTLADEAQGNLAPPVAPPPATSALTAGHMLREARLASGMHIGTLSLALKVPVKKLEALEADDWQQLPDMVFVRALATSVCRHIKTDSAPILAALPQSSHLQHLGETPKVAIQASFRSGSDSAWRTWYSRLSMPMMAGSAVLLLAALLLIFLPDFVKKQGTTKTEVVEKIEPVAPQSEAVAVGTMVTSPSAPVPGASSSAPAASAAPAAAASAPLRAPTAPVAPTTLPVASAAAAVVAAGVPTVRLAAKGKVWVQVKDSKGAILVQRELQPKEVVNVSGTPPLGVVLGRVNEIESVVVRGKPFNLAPVSAENIARFEVR